MAIYVRWWYLEVAVVDFEQVLRDFGRDACEVDQLLDLLFRTHNYCAC